MLDVDWRKRMTLRDVRYAIERVNNFYSDGVVFEGSMARCPWEAGMEIDNASSASTPDEDVGLDSPPTPSTSSGIPKEIVDAHAAFHSRWSKDSTSGIAFGSRPFAEEASYVRQWTKHSSCGATWGALDTPAISSSSDSDPGHFQMDLFNSTQSSESPGSSLPTTPNSFDTSFDARLPPNLRLPLRPGVGGMGLMINTNIPRPRIYDYEADNDGVIAAYSTHSSLMHTAIEYDPYSSMFYINSPIVCSPEKEKNIIVMPDSAVTAIGEDKEMTSPSIWTCSSATEMSSPSSSYTDSLPAPSVRNGVNLQFRRSASPSPEPLAYQTWDLFPTINETKVQSSSQICQPSPSFSTSITDILSPSSRPSNTLFTARKEHTNANNLLDTPTSHSNPSFPSNVNVNTKPSTKALLTFKRFHRTPSPRPSQGSSAPKNPHRRSRRTAAVAAGTSFPRHQKTADAVEQAIVWSAAKTTAAAAAEGTGTKQMELASMRRRRIRDVLEYQTSDDDDDVPTTKWNARQFLPHGERHSKPHQRQQKERLQSSQLHSPKQWFMRRRV